MIKVKVNRSNNGIIWEMTVEGHEFSEPGLEGIVCASVSTAIIVTTNAIKFLRGNEDIEIKVSRGYFKIHAIKYDVTIVKLLENLEYTLDELKKQYDQQISISKIVGDNFKIWTD